MYGMPASVNRRISWKPTPRQAAFPTLPGTTLQQAGRMPKTLMSSSVQNGNGSLVNAATASFWSQWTGASSSTNFTANVYNTIANITGSGFISGILGPTVPVTYVATTIDMEITIDGGPAQVVNFANGVNGLANNRCWMGQVNWANTRAISDYQGGSSSLTLIQNAYGQLFGPDYAREVPEARLRFESSLLVRIRCSANISNTGSFESRAGVLYTLD